MSETFLGVLQRLSSQVQALTRAVPAAPVWATVASVEPLQVTPDGEDAPLAARPENAAGPLEVGQRVLIQTWGRRVYILGPVRVPEPPPPRVAAQAGSTWVNHTANTDHAVEIDLAPGRFTTPPIISVTPQQGNPSQMRWSVHTVTPGKFTLMAHRTAAGNTRWDWLAVESLQ